MFARKILFFTLVVFCSLFEINAQSRLYPKGRFDSNNTLLKSYQQKVDNLLLNNPEDADFAYLVYPAWGPQQGCCYNYSTSTLVLKESEENIWYYYFSSNSNYKEGETPEVKIKEYSCTIPRKTAKCFEDLFYSAINSSSYLARPNGLDGVSYELLLNGGLFTAELWSPKEGTNCHKLEEILIELSKCIKDNNAAGIENLVPKVTELSETFKKLFPVDIK